ncbi:relaxase/mobilization nuclease domain-containing protein, partial [Bacillus wiedmannii]|uniref:relaxase/mobilization nuclease domain-containing protein n=1 Tax=Bacillus wiedmannii TaxID=1890302 RepID=UPI00211D2F9A
TLPIDILTPEQVHQYGVEFADNYLKGNHQYIVITHIETDHLHNHIVFNDIDFNKLKMFDSKRANTLDRLREENDKISEKYGLSIIEEGRKGRKKYLAFNEYVARSKQKSFKGNLEEIIDKNISKSNSFNEFLRLWCKNSGFMKNEQKIPNGIEIYAAKPKSSLIRYWSYPWSYPRQVDNCKKDYAAIEIRY